MLNDLKKLALVFSAALCLMGSSYGGEDLMTSAVGQDLAAMDGFKESDYPLDLAMEGNKGVLGDFRLLAVSDGYADYTKTFFYLYHPSGKPIRPFTGSGSSIVYSDAGGFRLDVSLTGKEADFSQYQADILSWSSDLRFVKLCVDSGFGYKSSDDRVYSVSAFEVMASDLKTSVSYAVGTEIKVSGYGSNKTMSAVQFDVLKIDPYAWACGLPGENGNSYDSWFKDGSLVTSNLCHTTVYSIMFPIDKDFGTCVGIKFAWTPVYVKYVSNGDGTYTSQRITGQASSGTRLEVDFDDTDNLDILSWDQQAWSFSNFQYHLDDFIFKSGQDSWKVPVVQKMETQGSLGYYKGSSDQASNPYVLTQVANAAAIEMAKDNPSSDLYCFHFDFRDTITSSEKVAWWEWNSLVRGVATVIELLMGTYGTQKFSSTGWDMEDVSVLQLRMMKDGKTYILAVSGDSKYIQGNTPFTAKSSLDIWKALLLVGGIFAVMCVLAWALDRGSSRSSKKRGNGYGRRRK